MSAEPRGTKPFIPPEYSRKMLTCNGAATAAANVSAAALSGRAGLPTVVVAGSVPQALSSTASPKSVLVRRELQKRRGASRPAKKGVGIRKTLGEVVIRSIGITRRNRYRLKTHPTQRAWRVPGAWHPAPAHISATNRLPAGRATRPPMLTGLPIRKRRIRRRGRENDLRIVELLTEFV